MRTLTLLLAAWAGLSPAVLADVLTLRFGGTVLYGDRTGHFTPGRPFTLTVAFELSAQGVQYGPDAMEDAGAVTFTLETPNLGETNDIELSLQLPPLETWETVMSVCPSGRVTTL